MIVVFGAGGFIGTYLVDRLAADGRETIASDLTDMTAYFGERGIPYRRLDITRAEDLEQLPASGIEAVVHLACVQPANVSEDRYDARDYIRVNVLGTLNILEFCRRNNIPRIVYTCSHRNTQGMWPEKVGTPIREADGRRLKYTGEYAMFSISESAAADCVEHYAQTFGMRGIVLRLPPVYGYGPHTEIFMHGKPLKTGLQVFIENARAGAPLEVWGDGERGRDIVYVKDVAAAIVRALDTPDAGGLYNIASGRALSVREQAESIVRVFSPPGQTSEIRLRPDLANNIEPYVYDIRRAHDELGWEPAFSFEAMLVDYQRELESGRFAFLVEKRRQMMAEAAAPPPVA